MAAHRENNFDAVRLIAAAAVIYGHAHPLTGTVDVGFMGNSVQSFAVKVFFVISGFLIATSWIADPNVPRYLEKRALRIFPALVVVVVLCAFVLGPVVTTLPLTQYFSNGRTRAYLLWNILLRPSYDLPDVFPALPYPVAVNGSLWSLPVEFAMYLLLPVLCVVSLRFRSRITFSVITTVFCVGALLYTRVLPAPTHPVVFYGTSLTSALDAAPYFLLGASYRVLGLERALSPVVALGLTGLALFFPPQGVAWTELTLFIVAPYAILSFAIFPHPAFSRVGRWGDFSYGLYLYGFPVQQAANFFSRRPLSALENTAISLPIALGLAVASWYFIEKRALTLKPRKESAAPSSVAQEPAT
jgi:peptidoglycan/LPS O-acetylase OafA/YrhL